VFDGHRWLVVDSSATKARLVGQCRSREQQQPHTHARIVGMPHSMR
jgi:hypothetical protein